MTDWAALDVAIGLAVTYFMLSLICSTLHEAISSAFGWRAKYLERWLANVLADPGASAADAKAAVEEFYAHPLIRPLMRQPRWWNTRKSGFRKPSYISAQTFSAALLSLPRSTAAAKADVDGAIAALPSAELRTVAAALRDEAVVDLKTFRERMERWYDDSMERVSGWYKRRVQLVLAIVGLVLAATLNADTLQIVRTLWSDKTVRAAVVADAARLKTAPPAGLHSVAKEVEGIKQLNVPLGWRLKRGDPRDLPHGVRLWVAKGIGLVLTMLALMLGAPFWFDLLSQLARLRMSGAPPPARGAVRSGEGEQKRAGPGVPSV